MFLLPGGHGGALSCLELPHACASIPRGAPAPAGVAQHWPHASADRPAVVPAQPRPASGNAPPAVGVSTMMPKKKMPATTGGKWQAFLSSLNLANSGLVPARPVAAECPLPRPGTISYFYS